LIKPFFCVLAACNLLTNEQKHFIISSETEEIRKAEEEMSPAQAMAVIKANVRNALVDALRQAQRHELADDGVVSRCAGNLVKTRPDRNLV
jgi:hypothetical protein